MLFINQNILLAWFTIGIVGCAASFTGSLARICSPKWIILAGLSLGLVATVLPALGGLLAVYFPSFCIRNHWGYADLRTHEIGFKSSRVSDHSLIVIVSQHCNF
jgi:hypothetical protein